MLICKFCERDCPNSNSLRNHERLCKKNPSSQKTVNNFPVFQKQRCSFCSKDIGTNNLPKHKKACVDNPTNKKVCPACKAEYTGKKQTCSYACANRYFRKGMAFKNKIKQYQTICFMHHKKECIICGETKIVAVHHYNEEHHDHRPENLVPMCPTHHQYMHSRYRVELQEKVDKYVTEFSNRSVG